MCLNTWIQAHGIVQAGLDVACTMRCCAVKLRHLQLDRLHASLVIRAHRRDKNAELIRISRLHTDDFTCRKHQRAHIQRRPTSIRRNPCGVSFHNLHNRVNEAILRERRHTDALSRVMHALCIHVRAEADDVAIFLCICLKALENLLAVVQQTCTFRERNGMVGG